MNGADVNAKNDKGWTPLLGSTYHNNSEISQLLIMNGADVNAKDNDGQTPLRIAIQNKNTEIIELLIKNGADVNPKINNGNTPLLWSISKNNTEISKLMMDKGADVNATDAAGRTGKRGTEHERERVQAQERAREREREVEGRAPSSIRPGERHRAGRAAPPGYVHPHIRWVIEVYLQQDQRGAQLSLVIGCGSPKPGGKAARACISSACTPWTD